MKIEPLNSDEALDRVLNGLAHVEAPPEFERRVLQAVRQTAAERETPVTAPAFAWLPSRRWAVAAGLAMLAIVTSVAVLKRHETALQNAVLKRPASPMVGAAPPTEAAETRSQGSHRRVRFSAFQHESAEPPTEDIDDLDTLAVIEMNAPSKPAPPLPLTHQEKLLAAAAHQASPVQVFSLQPEVRARQMELSKAEFHDFFEPPPVKASE